MREPLWLDIAGGGVTVRASLSTCRNCGKVKVASDPCGFDHAAALAEFGAFARQRTETVECATCKAVAENPRLRCSDHPFAPRPGDSPASEVTP